MSLPIITRSGSHLQIGGVTKRFSGLNAYWFGLDDNAGTSTGSFPSQATITSAMAGLHSMGASLVRAHTVGISTGTANSYLTGYTGSTPNYSNSNLAAADWAVYQAGLHGIYLMVPLTDNWNYYHGGLWNFVHWAFQQNSSGLTDINEGFSGGSGKDSSIQRQFFQNTTAGLRIRALFKDYIFHWLNHVNPYTGLAYKDDPTIAIVETGNEIYYAAQIDPGVGEWTQDIASYIKSVAPNKLVADGSAASGQAGSSMPGLVASAVDIIGGHYYPQDPTNGYRPQTFSATGGTTSFGGTNSARQQLSADISAAVSASKAYILGEYPWTRSDVSGWYSDISANANISADMAWSFIGGTETHGGSFGSDDFSVHYPYLSGNESTYAPALTSHITAISGVPQTTGIVDKVKLSLAVTTGIVSGATLTSVGSPSNGRYHFNINTAVWNRYVRYRYDLPSKTWRAFEFK